MLSISLMIFLTGLALINGKAYIMEPKYCTQFPCLIFEDNFEDFDTKTWEHEITMAGGGNWEFQLYHNNRTNSLVKNGMLYVKPNQLEDKYGEGYTRWGSINLWGMNGIGDVCTSNRNYGCERVGTDVNYLNPIQSARVRTLNSFSYKYGALEVRAQMPVGDWLWPAIWLLPKGWPYGEWPASGEIDLVESRGNEDYRMGEESLGVDMAGSTLHFGPFWPENGYDLAHASYKAGFGTFGNSMHIYRLEWNSNEFNWYIDGEHKLRVDPGPGGFWDFGGWQEKFGNDPHLTNPWAAGSKMAPFDQEFYIIMNVAVGGTNGFFPDEESGAINNPFPKPWNNMDQDAPKKFWDRKEWWLPGWTEDGKSHYNSPISDAAAMKVDYVRVWKMESPEE